MEVDRKVLKRAKQLKALAEGGEGAEKAKAQALYEKHLEKNGITEADIGLSSVQYHYFRYDKKSRFMLEMIMCHVIANALILTDVKKKNVLFAICSNDEAARIRSMFEFYLDAYRVEEEYFFAAFLHKNELTPNIVKEKKAGAGAIPDDELVFVDAEDGGGKGFDVKKKPAPAEAVVYTEFQQRKIKGLMSWLPRYDMPKNALSESPQKGTSNESLLKH
jgi:hypothetical protein